MTESSVTQRASSSLKTFLLGWVGADLAVRSDLVVRAVGEVFGFGTTIGITVPIVLTTEYVLALSTVRAVLGWGLFWLLIFVYCPLFFPKQGAVEEDWTVGLPNRLLLASAAVAVGLTVEGWAAAWETQFNYGGIVTPTVFVSPITALGILAGTVIGYGIVKGRGPTRIGYRYLYVPSPRYGGERVTGDRYLFIVLFLGAVLAVLSVLFPLPELILFGLQLSDSIRALGVLVTVGSYSLTVRSDFAAGLAGASLAIWQDLEETFHLVYVLAPLLWYWVIAVGTISVLDLWAIFRSTPAQFAVFVSMLIVAGGHAMIYAFRLSERIRDRAIGTEERSARIPLALLPVGLAIGVIFLVVLPAEGRGQNAIAALGLEPVLIGVALASILLSILTVWRPSALSFPSIDRSPREMDHAVAALATVVVVLSVSPAALVAGELSRLTLVLGIFTGPLTISSLWIGPRVLLPDRSRADAERLKTGIKRGVAVFLIYIPVSALREALVAGWSPSGPTRIVAVGVVVVGGTLAAIAMLCTGLFAVTLLFRRYET